MAAVVQPLISNRLMLGWEASREALHPMEAFLAPVRIRVAQLLCLLTILLSSCSVSTIIPGGADLTQTPTAPSAPGPTATAHVTREATTIIVTPPSLTPEPSPAPSSGTAPVEFGCKVLSQSLRNGAHFGPKERFEMGWKVRNNGGAAWDPSTVTFAYFSGTKMYQAERYDLPEAVNRGHTVALGASMVAPRNAGSYTTVWSLRSGNDTFCRVSLRIIVP